MRLLHTVLFHVTPFHIFHVVSNADRYYSLILQYPTAQYLSFTSEQMKTILASSSTSDLFVILAGVLLSSYGQGIAFKLQERTIDDICCSLKQFLSVWSLLSPSVFILSSSYF